jgi:hypothetical protein
MVFYILAEIAVVLLVVMSVRIFFKLMTLLSKNPVKLLPPRVVKIE